MTSQTDDIESISPRWSTYGRPDRTQARPWRQKCDTKEKEDNEDTYESKLNEKRIRIKRASGDVEKSSPISLVSHSVRSSVTVAVSQRRRS